MDNFDFQKGEILLIDKPLNWSSFDVVNKIRYVIAFKLEISKKKLKVGHAGTLDPLATGLLIIATGRKTKEIETFQAQEKEYVGEFHIGQTTPSYDLETEVNQEFNTAHITPALIQETTKQFLGEIEQIPPMFSAVRIDGKRMYEHARKGNVMEIEPRKITIKTFEIIKIDLPKIEFKVVCSKGTYIRSLARDFGEALKSGAYLTGLRRTKIGDFDVENAYNLDDFVKEIEEN